MRAYNPLSVDELGRNAARALMGYPSVELPPEEQFDGAGVYTIHYSGAFSAYAGLKVDEPIYVGKADLTGEAARTDSSRAGPTRSPLPSVRTRYFDQGRSELGHCGLP